MTRKHVAGSMVGTMSAKQAWSIGAATAEVVIWHGAVSSGKTIGSLFKLLMKIATAPLTGEIVIIGRTRDTVYRNIMQALMDPTIFGELTDHIAYNRGAPTATIFGKTVHIIGSSDVRAENIIRGMTISIAYLDEATLVSEEFFNMLHSRLRVRGYNCQLFVTTNPDAPAHWLKTKWIDREGDPDLSIKVFHFGIEDNRHNLPEGYIEARMAQFSGLWFDRFILGLWTMADGVIYDMFDPARHVVESLPEMHRLIAIGIDDGVQHPAAGILLGIGTDNRLYAVTEWAPPSGTPADRSKHLRLFMAEHGTPDYLFVDPSAASLKMQLNRDGFRNVVNAANSHKAGLGLVASLLSTEQLMVHTSCTNLLAEIGGYVWDKKAAKKGEDKPVKENDDFCDAWRYAVLTSRPWWQQYLPMILLPESEAA